MTKGLLEPISGSYTVRAGTRLLTKARPSEAFKEGGFDGVLGESLAEVWQRVFARTGRPCARLGLAERRDAHTDREEIMGGFALQPGLLSAPTWAVMALRRYRTVTPKQRWKSI